MQTVPGGQSVPCPVWVSGGNEKELYENIETTSPALRRSASTFFERAEANKGTLQLTDKVTVEGKPLNSGKYTVEWPAVQVTLLQGKQVVATFSAHLTEQAASNPQDAYGTATGPDGSRSLTAIYLSRKRVALQLDQNAASQQPDANPSSK